MASITIFSIYSHQVQVGCVKKIINEKKLFTAVIYKKEKKKLKVFFKLACKFVSTGKGDKFRKQSLLREAWREAWSPQRNVSDFNKEMKVHSENKTHGISSLYILHFLFCPYFLISELLSISHPLSLFFLAFSLSFFFPFYFLFLFFTLPSFLSSFLLSQHACYFNLVMVRN